MQWDRSTAASEVQEVLSVIPSAVSAEHGPMWISDVYKRQVYSRLGSYYVGEEQQKFQKTYPEFLESGSGVRFLDDGATLIGEDMVTRLQVYDGLRLNNGNTLSLIHI